jgi:hypothetical protein
MARKYEFPYDDYLSTNDYINQAVMQFLWEGEDFKGSGARDESGIIKHFPEVMDLIKHLIKLDELPEKFLDEIKEYDSVLMAVTVGDLWITFSKMMAPKVKGGVSFFKGGFKIIIGITDDNVSFTLRGK